MQTNANARRGYGEKELSYTVGGNVNWYTHHKEQHGGSPTTTTTTTKPLKTGWP